MKGFELLTFIFICFAQPSCKETESESNLHQARVSEDQIQHRKRREKHFAEFQRRLKLDGTWKGDGIWRTDAINSDGVFEGQLEFSGVYLECSTVFLTEIDRKEGIREGLEWRIIPNAYRKQKPNGSWSRWMRCYSGSHEWAQVYTCFVMRDGTEEWSCMRLSQNDKDVFNTWDIEAVRNKTEKGKRE